MCPLSSYSPPTILTTRCWLKTLLDGGVREKEEDKTGRPPELANALLKAWPPGLLWLHRDGVEVVYNFIILVSIAQIILTCTE